MKPKRDCTRRRVLATAGMWALLPKAALAGGGGGGKEERADPSRDYSSRDRVVVEVSPQKVSRMSGDEFKEARARVRKQGKVLLVDGYDLDMTERIEKMMDIDPQSTGTLLRDMQRLTLQEKRVARIEEEDRYQVRLIHSIEDNVSELNAKNTPEAKAEAAREVDRIKRATRIRRHLRRWERWELDPKRGRVN